LLITENFWCHPLRLIKKTRRVRFVWNYPMLSLKGNNYRNEIDNNFLSLALTVPAAVLDERNVFAFKRERPKSQTWMVKYVRFQQKNKYKIFHHQPLQI
jgi:hypothetical protein